MTRIILFFAISLLIIPISNAQKLKGNKNIITEERNVMDFSSILVKNKLNVFIEESSTNSVHVETDENLQVAIDTRVFDGVLEVYLSQEIKRTNTLNIYIGVTDSIQRIEAQDRANIIGKSVVHTGTIELIAKNYASINLILNSDELIILGRDKSSMELDVAVSKDISVVLEQRSYIKMNASANKINASLTDNTTLKLSGKCKELITTTNANASIKAKDMLTDYADIKATDRSNVYVNVKEEIIINAVEMSEIYIYDDPKIFIDKFTGKSTLYKR